MAITTVPELISRAVAAADMQDNFISKETWLYWANVAEKKLAVMVAQLGVPYRQYDDTISLDGSLQYNLAEPLAIVGVYYPRSDGKWDRLKGINPIQRNVTNITITGTPKEFHIFRNTSSQITFRFYPVPTEGIMIVRAIQYPKKLVYDTPTSDEADFVDYPLGWEDYIVLSMARNALSKEETVNPLIQSQLQECIDHIETSAANYLIADNHKIRNVKEDNFDPEWYWPI